VISCSELSRVLLTFVSRISILFLQRSSEYLNTLNAQETDQELNPGFRIRIFPSQIPDRKDPGSGSATKKPKAPDPGSATLPNTFPRYKDQGGVALIT
jgi:hypothetical protein